MELNEWYLDDATLGGSFEGVRDDLVVLSDKLSAIDLKVNSSKCRFLFSMMTMRRLQRLFLEQCIRKSKLFRGVT